MFHAARRWPFPPRSPVRKPKMAPSPDHLPRRHFAARLASHRVTHVLDQHDVGRDSQRGDADLVLRRSSRHSPPVQVHVYLLLHHDHGHDRPRRRGAPRTSRSS